jgi:hypothetical protein
MRRSLCSFGAVAALLAFEVSLAQPTAIFGRGSACERCGVVVSIEMSTQREDWVPLGVVPVGPTLASSGPVEGRSALMFGAGGAQLVTIGAAGGAVYAKRSQAYEKRRWEVTVEMDEGGRRVLTQRYEPFLREGDRVRVSGTQLELID